MKNNSLLRVLLVLGLTESLAAGEMSAPAFTKKPVVTKAGDKAQVNFTVNRETDVTVYIDDAKGNVIRHLVSGVLGTNAPAPLKSNSLSQAIEWDGLADYGKPAEGGPFKVRVALGLGAKYERAIRVNPTSFSSINALGVGPDGTVYVAAMAAGAVWSGPFIVALNRDGSYQHTVMPFPSNLKMEAVQGITSFELSGRPAPLISDRTMGLYGNLAITPKSQMVVGAGKAIYMLTLFHDAYGHGTPQLTVLNVDGSCPDKLAFTPNATSGIKKFADFSSGLALASDGKSVYVAGVVQGKEDPVLYRFSLDDKEKWEVFFGELARTAKNHEHLGGAPNSVVADGKGKIFVSDYKNDRILVLAEKDGRYIAEIAATKPDFLSINPKNGDLYASSRKGGNDVVATKYVMAIGGKEYKEAYSVTIPLSRNDTYSMVVDVYADKPVVWAGDRVGVLVRMEDNGDKFGAAKVLSVGCFGGTAESYMAISVDRKRKEVYARNGTGGGILMRYCEDTDEFEEVRLPGDAYGGGKGFEVMPHPDGNLYGLRWPYCFMKWDRNGKPLPWEKPMRPTDEEMLFNSSKTTGDYPIKLPTDTSFVPVSMTELPHTLGIRESDGHLFALTFKVRGRVPKCLNEYLPTGQQVNTDPIIWYASDAVVGPRFDAQGNIYVAEAIKPKGWMPPELTNHFARIGVKGLTGPAAVADNMYGSIVKFTPKGGTFDFGNAFGARLVDNPWDPKLGKLESPYKGELKLPAGLKTIEGETYPGKPAKVIGAEWIHPGIEHVGMFACNCENTSFDVDPFGRVFYPNEHLYRVEVIDTAGNAVTTIGGYGNSESCGPDSPIIDDRTGKLRMKLPQDKDIKSPFAEPEIAFSWLISVGANDKYLYTGDSLNRRMLKLKMTYAVEEACQVP